MRKLPFYWVDAFTKTKLGGNPCAVVVDAEDLSTEEMQALAKEFNISETAFLMRISGERYRARYFTVTRELPFAGHPTISCAHVLASTGRVEGKVVLELPAGEFPVTIENEGRGVTRSTMIQQAPKFMREYDRPQVARIFGLDPTELIPGVPIQTVSTGNPILMIPCTSLSAVRRARLGDEKAWAQLKEKGDFNFPFLFCLGGATPKGTTFARLVGLAGADAEDPFTGSATGCMAAYLWNHGLIKGPSFIAEQGHFLGRPGEAEVGLVGEAKGIKGISVSGAAVTLVSGHLEI